MSQLKADSSLRPTNRDFAQMSGRLLELVQARQKEIGMQVYESMRVYFDVLTDFIRNSRTNGGGFWGDTWRQLMFDEASKDFYSVSDECNADQDEPDEVEEE